MNITICESPALFVNKWTFNSYRLDYLDCHSDQGEVLSFNFESERSSDLARFDYLHNMGMLNGKNKSWKSDLLKDSQPKSVSFESDDEQVEILTLTPISSGGYEFSSEVVNSNKWPTNLCSKKLQISYPENSEKTYIATDDFVDIEKHVSQTHLEYRRKCPRRWGHSDDIELFKSFNWVLKMKGYNQDEFWELNWNSSEVDMILKQLLGIYLWKNSVQWYKDRVKNKLKSQTLSYRQKNKLKELCRQQLRDHTCIDFKLIAEEFPGKTIATLKSIMDEYSL